jgi:hypothetical protein
MRTVQTAGILSLALIAMGNQCGTDHVSGEADVTFQWSFNGGEGCNAAGVQAVQVQIEGQTVNFPCSAWENGGRAGTIGDLEVGTADFTLSGLSNTYDSSGDLTGQVTTYQATGAVNIQYGDNETPVIDLSPTGTSPTASNLIFLWQFDGQTCSQDGNPQVTINITDPVGGNVDQAVACDEDGVDGVSVGASTSVTGSVGFTAGSYPFSLSATDRNGVTYAASGTAFANGIADTVVHADLESPGDGGSTGSLSFALTFGGSACGDGGVTTAQTFLTDGDNNQISGSNVSTSCGDLPVTYTGLQAPAIYFLNAQASGGGQTTYALLQYAVTVSPGATSTYAVDVPVNSGQ